MAPNNSLAANRMEGRLFSDQGRLCMVVSVDVDSNVARVSSRVEGEQRVVEMPVSEVSLRLAAYLRSSSGPNGSEARERVVQKAEGWFFVAREGMQGPYPTNTAANDALNAHIVSLQTTTPSYR